MKDHENATHTQQKQDTAPQNNAGSVNTHPTHKNAQSGQKGGAQKC